MKEQKIMSHGKKKRVINQLSPEEYRVLFDSHVEEQDDGCYLWTAAKNNIGYGMFRYKNGMATAHRTQMDLLGHNIQGKIVYHTCDNYHCVNPDHLRVGLLKDKIDVMRNKGRTGTHWSDPKYNKTCEHCGKTMSPAVYGHLHGDKCKQKP